MPILHFGNVGPRARGGNRPMPAKECFYALRVPFIEGSSQKRYVFYKVILAKPDSLLIIENPLGFGYSKGSSKLDDSVLKNFMGEGPRRLILESQPAIDANCPEEEHPRR